MMSYKQSQQGFSLVETFVSITILLIVIVGPMTISSQTAKSSTFASEQVVAFFLAQEGVELVEKARNDLLLQYYAGNNSDPWADFTSAGPSSLFRDCYVAAEGNGCGLTVSEATGGALNTPQNCTTDITNCKLYFDDSNASIRSRYTHSAGGNETTPFTRRITMRLVNADEVLVTSIVTWRTGSIRNEQRVAVETRLFNVYGN